MIRKFAQSTARLARHGVCVASFLALTAVGVGCGGSKARLLTDEVLLCDCGVDPAPYEARLRERGQDPGAVIDADDLEDLAFVVNGEQYRYVVLPDGRIRVAPIPLSAEDNDYVHPVLGEGQPVRGAGFLMRNEDGDGWTVDRNSQAYCPPPGTEEHAVEALVRIGARRDGIRVVRVDPECMRDRPVVAPSRDLRVR